MSKDEKTNDAKESCFILTPFDDQFRKVLVKGYVMPAIIEVGLEPRLADTSNLSVQIMTEIWSQIQKSLMLVAVLSTGNRNVYYELGLAHALSKPVVLIADESEGGRPFDIAGINTILYDRNDPAWGDTLKKRVIKSLKDTIADPVSAVPAPFCNIVPSDAPDPTKQEAVNRRVEERLARLGTLLERLITDVDYGVHPAVRLYPNQGTVISWGKLGDSLPPEDHPDNERI